MPGTGITRYFNADHGDHALGSAASMALGIEGSQTKAAIGAWKVRALPDHTRLTVSLELALRGSRSEVLGATYSDERANAAGRAHM